MKRIMKVQLATVAVSGLLLAGCSSTDETAATDAMTSGTDAMMADGCEDYASYGMHEGDTAELYGSISGTEADDLQTSVAEFERCTGITVTYNGTDQFETEINIRVDGGTAPDLAIVPQPGLLQRLVGTGAVFAAPAAVEANVDKFWSADWKNYGTVGSTFYSAPLMASVKGWVWYSPTEFAANGYEVPTTWDEMMTLTETMAATGGTGANYKPWCVGIESGTATGWPGTDWIEDIYLRQSGGDAYADWFKHDIPFNDPSVVAAFDAFGEIFFGEGFVLGGPENVAGINFNDSPGPLFGDPPGCLMLKQGSFISNVFKDTPEYDDGEESEIAVFPFPTIDGNVGALGGGDTLIVFDGSEENIQVIRDWISPDWQCTLASASGGGVAPYGGHGVEGVERLPGHKDVDVDCYETDASKAFATSATEALAANTFAFDASDLMPPEVGQGSFWEAMVNWSRGASSQEVTDAVENNWP